MQKFKFLHVADVHLDVPMQKISTKLNIAADATFLALENLVQFALEKKVDAVIFAGDIWNDEDASLRARLKFKKATDILSKNNISVYVAHGNHDPLTKEFESIQYSENVHVFTENMTSFSFKKEDNLLACIHGISHTQKKETSNLSKLFIKLNECEKEKCFHIHVLHTSLMGNEKEDNYAPCSLADLREKNPHYWALGHIHTFQILNENPEIIFPGSLQGTHINEDNAHGCVYVELKREENSSGVEIIKEFIPLAPLMWLKLEYILEEECEDFVSLQEKIQDYLIEKTEEILNSSQEYLKKYTKQIVVRLTLAGKSYLNSELRDIYKLKELKSSLNEDLVHSNPALYINDIELETVSKEEEKSIEELLKMDSFLAEVLKKGEKLLKISEDEVYAEMEKIYKESPILKGHYKLLPLPKDKDFYKKIIVQAQYLTRQLLEKAE